MVEMGELYIEICDCESRHRGLNNLLPRLSQGTPTTVSPSSYRLRCCATEGAGGGGKGKGFQVVLLKHLRRLLCFFPRSPPLLQDLEDRLLGSFGQPSCEGFECRGRTRSGFAGLNLDVVIDASKTLIHPGLTPHLSRVD